MIYLHEMRGADRAITRAIDAHVNAEREGHDGGRPGRSQGTLMAQGLLGGLSGPAVRVGITSLTWAYVVRAGEGNRTLMTSLEGWGSAIELRPRRRLAPGKAATPVAYPL
jgi:hypothetical protein